MEVARINICEQTSRERNECVNGALTQFFSGTDTVDADTRPGELLIKYSRRREMASLFNYASMAHNNHFFFNCLVSHKRLVPFLVLESCI